MFQSFNLFPHMTVLRNITLAPVKALGASRREAEQEARTLLERFGLLDKQADYPDRLSGDSSSGSRSSGPWPCGRG